MLNLKGNKRGPFFSSGFILKHVSVTLRAKNVWDNHDNHDDKDNQDNQVFLRRFLLKHVSVTLWEKECLEATSAFPRQQEEPPTDADHVVFLKLRQAD